MTFNQEMTLAVLILAVLFFAALVLTIYTRRPNR